jgi:hypothetical protein
VGVLSEIAPTIMRLTQTGSFPCKVRGAVCNPEHAAPLLYAAPLSLIDELLEIRNPSVQYPSYIPQSSYKDAQKFEL